MGAALVADALIDRAIIPDDADRIVNQVRAWTLRQRSFSTRVLSKWHPIARIASI